MAKKAKPTPTEPESEGGTSMIKLRLSTKEAKLIRLAAAINNLQPGVYARRVVIETAKAELQAAKGDWL